MGREAIVRRLAAALDELLAAHGFSGKSPHWRRRDARGLAFVGLQRDKWGQGFRVEVGALPAWIEPLQPRLFARWRTLDVFALSTHLRSTVVTGHGFAPYDEASVTRVLRRLERQGLGFIDQQLDRAPKLRRDRYTRALLAMAAGGDASSLAIRWLDEQSHATSCAAFLRAQAALGKEQRVWVAWIRAKAGDAREHQLLVEMLDDPDVSRPNRYIPGVSIRAAQALADLHAWPFTWGKPSVARIRRRVLAGGT